MEVRLTTLLPLEWAKATPLETYETQFLYVGLSRYDTTKQVVSSIVKTHDNKTLYTETPYGAGSLARCYVTEFATVTVYSLSPRVWVEDLGVDGKSVFIAVG